MNRINKNPEYKYNSFLTFNIDMKLTKPLFNQSIFGLIVVGIFISVCYKALYVPITHDEVATTILLTKSSYWDLIIYKVPIPNNHILNSILTKAVVSITGVNQLSIRIINVLFFTVFSLGIYRISKSIFSLNSWFFLAASMIFFTNPYLLDFFSISRGYGLSIALCTISISYLISGFKFQHHKHIWYALILATLASYANFTLLYFWMSVIISSKLYFLFYRKTLNKGLIKNLLWLIALFTSFISLIIVPIIRMSETDQFRFWKTQGFYEDTVYYLARASLYDSKALFFQLYEVVTFLAIGIIILNSCFIIYQLRNKDTRIQLFKRPIFITTIILLLIVIVNNLHVNLFDAPHLVGRTALFYYSLFASSFVSSFALFKSIHSPKIKVSFSLIVVLLCLIQLIHTWKSDEIKEWYYDSNNLHVIDYLESNRKGKNITLHTNWLFNPSFKFYNDFENLDWLTLGAYNKIVCPDIGEQYYYVLREDVPTLINDYIIIKEFDSEGVLMLKR